MWLFDIFKKEKHEEEVEVTYNGLTFMAPKPISNEDYQQFRKTQAAWLENHYDLNSIHGIQSIPVSPNLPKHPGSGDLDVTGDIDYYLHQKAYEHEENGRIELAIECLRKSNAIREVKRTVYRKTDYYALVRMLARNGQILAAQREKSRLDRLFSNDHFEGEDKVIEREFERGKEKTMFLWLQLNLPDMCPKSLSGFPRMKTQNTKNYQKIVAEATKLGYKME